MDSTESQHGAIGRGFSRFGTLNLTSIKISGYCWSKTKLDGIGVNTLGPELDLPGAPLLGGGDKNLLLRPPTIRGMLQGISKE